MNETIAHNVAAINAMLTKNHTAVVNGPACPKCGQPANAAIVANFGHCLACQSATIGR